MVDQVQSLDHAILEDRRLLIVIVDRMNDRERMMIQLTEEHTADQRQLRTLQEHLHMCQDRVRTTLADHHLTNDTDLRRQRIHRLLTTLNESNNQYTSKVPFAFPRKWELNGDNLLCPVYMEHRGFKPRGFRRSAQEYIESASDLLQTMFGNRPVVYIRDRDGLYVTNIRIDPHMYWVKYMDPIEMSRLGWDAPATVFPTNGVVPRRVSM
jgi:hypothetical protein